MEHSPKPNGLKEGQTYLVADLVEKYKLRRMYQKYADLEMFEHADTVLLFKKINDEEYKLHLVCK
jgi:hypothetical protein